jgi:beta-glucosidase
LRCFADAGANLKQVGTPLRITAPQGFVVTLSNARVEATGSVVPCPPKG